MKKMIRKRLALRGEAIRQLSDQLIDRVHGARAERSEVTMATDCFNTCGGPNLCPAYDLT